MADRDYIRSISGSDPTYQMGVQETRYVRLTYRMKNGQTVRRVYHLWVTAERAAAPGTFRPVQQPGRHPSAGRDPSGRQYCRGLCLQQLGLLRRHE